MSRGALASTALCLLVLTACSSDSWEVPKFKLNSDFGFTSADSDAFRKKNDAKVQVVQPQDLVGADGHCAGGTSQTSFEPGLSSLVLAFQAGPQVNSTIQDPSAPPTATLPAPPRGIALSMTECEVVGLAGNTDQIAISTNERGERSVVLTYTQGPHLGIYRFVAGHLTSIERLPDAPPQAKPAKPKKTAKPS